MFGSVTLTGLTCALRLLIPVGLRMGLRSGDPSPGCVSLQGRREGLQVDLSSSALPKASGAGREGEGLVAS